MPAVDYRLGNGGLEFSELSYLLKILISSQKAIGMTITIYNPNLDASGSIAKNFVSCIAKGLLWDEPYLQNFSNILFFLIGMVSIFWFIISTARQEHLIMLLIFEYLREVDQRLFSQVVDRKVWNFNKVLQVKRKTLWEDIVVSFSVRWTY